MSGVNLKIVSKYKAVLGEGPTYDEENNRIYWVDILGKKILYLDENERENIVSLNDVISSLCVIDSERVIATVKHSFSTVYVKEGKVDEIIKVNETDDNRFNDGKCDKLGRYWAGTMNERREPLGSLYKLEGTKLTKMLTGLRVSNGLGWSPDWDKMYLIDSPTRKVYSFNFDINKGDIYNRDILIDFVNEPGNPDGMSVDEEGFLWIAHWGGGKVSRWSPTGVKVEEIRTGFRYTTSITFGGKDLDIVYITTAGEDGGYLLMGKVKVRGIEGFKFH
ncbi:SMP-30/gluconolactonase/LRE family protein [Acidianus sp. RZ1]|uniref:SMP-30/gluconolactonase/LRE family protein n=1 Tax=Acidianus sp. RZ1 TaxID=1540082 RepID=UPI001491DE63|nr:SMP-30/gluconolactonase/LRE family protein [Acidianus sp. RZ1]NON63108.1 SMP-30/gluconolactonase/LRE family protein [Acidianus sp. RZ1]